MSDSEGNDRALKWMRAEVLSTEQKVMYDLVNPRYNVRRLCADAPKVSTHAPASIPAQALCSLFTDIRTIPCVEIQLEETVVSGTRSRMFIRPLAPNPTRASKIKTWHRHVESFRADRGLCHPSDDRSLGPHTPNSTRASLTCSEVSLPGIRCFHQRTTHHGR